MSFANDFMINALCSYRDLLSCTCGFLFFFLKFVNNNFGTCKLISNVFIVKIFKLLWFGIYYINILNSNLLICINDSMSYTIPTRAKNSFLYQNPNQKYAISQNTSKFIQIKILFCSQPIQKIGPFQKKTSRRACMVVKVVSCHSDGPESWLEQRNAFTVSLALTVLQRPAKRHKIPRETFHCQLFCHFSSFSCRISAFQPCSQWCGPTMHRCLIKLFNHFSCFVFTHSVSTIRSNVFFRIQTLPCHMCTIKLDGKQLNGTFSSSFFSNIFI